ncbi:unnamed protein product [Sympodiomycopsis kandeliae]
MSKLSATASSADRPEYLAPLSAAQFDAATHPADGALSISAPPGSGKTRVLTSRVAWLVNDQKLMPEEMIVVTFTNKAANEMRLRLKKLIGEDKTFRLVLGTFHALCARFLRRYGQMIDLPNNFSIMDAEDSRKVLKEIISGELKEHLQAEDLKIKSESAQGTISWAKAKGVSPEAYRANLQKKETGKSWRSNAEETSSYKAAIATIYEMYTEKLRQANALDFDDLLVFGVRLLRKSPHVVNNIRHVLVDEMQDTNTTQYELMRLFASAQKHLTTVGDPDQSVYGWRAAEQGNLDRMSKEFTTSTFLLEENYRSTGKILQAALKVIEQDHQRVAKGLFTSHPAGPPVTLKKVASPTYEARFIATEIKRLVAYSGGMLNYNDFVVLLRYNALSREVEQALQAESIPSRMVGGSKFFERMEVKDVLAYLQLVVNPNYTPAFSRVLNVPKRGIGDKGLKDFVARAEQLRLSPMQLAELVVNSQNAETSAKGKGAKKTSAANKYGVKPAIIKGLTALVSAVQELRKLAVNNAEVERIIDFIVENVDYKSHLAKEQDADARMENVKELVNFSQIVTEAAKAMPHLRRNGQLADLASLAGNKGNTDSDSEYHTDADDKKSVTGASDDTPGEDEFDDDAGLHSQASDRKPTVDLSEQESKSSLLSGVEAIAEQAAERVVHPSNSKRKRTREQPAAADVIEVVDSSDEDSGPSVKGARGASKRKQTKYSSDEDFEPVARNSSTKKRTPRNSAHESVGTPENSDGSDIQATDIPEDSPVRVFLEACTLSTDAQSSEEGKDPAKDGPKVTLSTCHAAKGLEYPVVFVAGVEDGIFPFFRCEKQHEIDEERRLLYVAMTRAQGLLYLTWCKERMMRGEYTPKDLSQFLTTIAPRSFGGIAPPPSAVKKTAKKEQKDANGGSSSSSVTVEWSAQRPEIDAEARQVLATVLERSNADEDTVQAKIEEFDQTRTADAIRQPEPSSANRGGYGGSGSYGGFGDGGGFGGGGFGYGFGGSFGNAGRYGSSDASGSGGFGRSFSSGSQYGNGAYAGDPGPIAGTTSNTAGFSSALKHFGSASKSGSSQSSQDVKRPSALDRKSKGSLGAGRSAPSGSNRTILTPHGISKDEGPDLYNSTANMGGFDGAPSSVDGQTTATKVPTSNYSGFYKNPALDTGNDEKESGKSKVGLHTFQSDHQDMISNLKSFAGTSDASPSQYEMGTSATNNDPMAPMPPRAFGSAPKVGAGRKGSKNLGMRRK